MPNKRYKVTYDIMDENYTLIGYHSSEILAVSKEDAYSKAVETAESVSDSDKTYMPLKISENDARRDDMFSFAL